MYDKMKGGGKFTGVCGNCKEVCSYKRKDCLHPKAEVSNNGAGGGGGESTKTKKTCNHCGKPGHLEAGCWIKNPDLEPQWIKNREKKAKEASGASVELMCTVIDVPDDRTKGEKAYDTAMKFMDENLDLNDEPVDVSNYYPNKPMTTEELKAQEEMEKQSEDPKQDFGCAC